jgi:hypothetical protein
MHEIDLPQRSQLHSQITCSFCSLSVVGDVPEFKEGRARLAALEDRLQRRVEGRLADAMETQQSAEVRGLGLWGVRLWGLGLVAFKVKGLWLSSFRACGFQGLGLVAFNECVGFCMQCLKSASLPARKLLNAISVELVALWCRTCGFGV